MGSMALPRFAAVFALTLALVIAGASAARDARAEPPSKPSASSVEEAHYLFAQGTAHYGNRRFGEALQSFEQSYQLVPSPNSGLMVARCLRDLGRQGDAAAWYARAEADAKKRVADGDAKYAQTAEAAASEGATLRATLGTLHVTVRNAPRGTRVLVDGNSVALPSNGDMVAFHAPGEVSVRVEPPSGPSQGQVATVQARGEARMVFDAGGGSSEGAGEGSGAGTGAGATAGGPGATGGGAGGAGAGAASGADSGGGTGAPASGSSRGDDDAVDRGRQGGGRGARSARDRWEWTKPASAVAGGVSVLGFGLGIGFGLTSRSIYDDLAHRCGSTGCGPNDRADADRGKRDQTIGNVGLVVGVSAAVVAVSLLVIGLTAK
jgi:hypothetical protein